MKTVICCQSFNEKRCFGIWSLIGETSHGLLYGSRGRWLVAQRQIRTRANANFCCFDDISG